MSNLQFGDWNQDAFSSLFGINSGIITNGGIPIRANTCPDKSVGSTVYVFHSLTRFESLLTVVQTLKKSLSTLYQLLETAVSTQDRYKSRWEKDLGMEFTSKQEENKRI